MPSLSDKLKSLGVKVGAGDLEAGQRATEPQDLEQALGGRPLETPQGETFAVDTFYQPGHAHGRASLEMCAPLHGMAAWVGNARLAELPPEAFAFLDTETTGLSGGTGTYAFLIGVGRFEGEGFHLAQFFLDDPLKEPAQLYALEEFLAPCQALVTFNGKTFDVPLLRTRYTTHGWKAPFSESVHVDLLHLARRLWSERLPSRTLLNLEWQILGAARSEQDIPGWMVPQCYFDYLRTGDPEPLKSVLYHNAMDVISLAALLDHMADLLAHPLQSGSRHGVDLLALAKLFEDLGDFQTATRLYVHGLEHEDIHTQRLPRALLLRAIQRLALIYKRQGDFPAAIALWEQVAHHGQLQARVLDACVELAKYYEHRARDYAEALRWTQAAIERVQAPPTGDAAPHLDAYEQRQWLASLTHRLERLERKANKG